VDRVTARGTPRGCPAGFFCRAFMEHPVAIEVEVRCTISSSDMTPETPKVSV